MTPERLAEIKSCVTSPYNTCKPSMMARELLAEIDRLRDENLQWEKCYNIRGKALLRPCPQCGRQPQIVKLHDGNIIAELLKEKS